MRSMTGFGEACVEADGHYVRVEISSVNQRHSNIQVNLNQPSLKEKVVNKIKGSIARGSVEVRCESDILGREKEIPEVNRELLEAYLGSLSDLEAEFDAVSNSPGAIDLLELPGVVEVRTERVRHQEAEALLLEAVDEALEELLKMRSREGEKIAEDLQGWVEDIRERIDQIEARVPEALERYRQQVLESVESILEITGEEKQERLEKELENYAEKCDISEEVSRIRSHLNQFEEYLAQSGTVGKSLEFLLQELQREINTVGAKGNDAKISQLSVEVKSELEKCREQVKNIE